MTRFGWDIGGAHLKVARAEGDRLRAVLQLPCPLWQGLDRLRQALDEVRTRWPDATRAAARHRVTMTGELVDLFPDRGSGVAALLRSLAACLPPATLSVYAGRDGLLPLTALLTGGAPAVPAAAAGRIASANWLASAALAGQRLAGVPFGVLLDIGSTTSDLIAFDADGALGDSVSDADRLASDELLYTGVVRTPVATLTRRAPFAGRWQTLANELFATAADVYRLLDWLPDDADRLPSADGRGKTPAESAARLARVFGRDVEPGAPLTAWRAAAGFVARQQQHALHDALDRLLSARAGSSPPVALVGAGCGRFLVRRLAAAGGYRYVDFGALCADGDDGLARAAADCAPAAALALLSAAPA